MQTANLLPLVLVIALVAYGLAYLRSRSVASPLGGIRHLKALPFYYAARAALWCAIPSLLLLGIWAAFEGKVIQDMVMASLPEDMAPTSAGEASLLLSQISNVAAGKLDPASCLSRLSGPPTSCRFSGRRAASSRPPWWS